MTWAAATTPSDKFISGLSRFLNVLPFNLQIIEIQNKVGMNAIYFYQLATRESFLLDLGFYRLISLYNIHNTIRMLRTCSYTVQHAPHLRACCEQLNSQEHLRTEQLQVK